MGKQADLSGCLTAYDCRDRLPESSSWMSDDDLKLLPLWQEARLESGAVYFDLNNPNRGPFVAADGDHRSTDRSYVRHRDVPEEVWAKVITWRQPVSESQGASIAARAENLAIPEERGAAGDVRPHERGAQH